MAISSGNFGIVCLFWGHLAKRLATWEAYRAEGNDDIGRDDNDDHMDLALLGQNA